MEFERILRNGGGASLLGRNSKGLCHRHDNTLYVGENTPEVGAEKSKGYADIRHPEAKPKDLKRFFATAQNDMDMSRLGILAQQEIPEQVRDDVDILPLPPGEGEVVRAKRVTTSGEGKKEILKPVQDDDNNGITTSNATHSPRNDMDKYTKPVKNDIVPLVPRNDSKELNDFKKKAAFTLAEVLITLGIIGIVAAMTIPTLVANYQQKSLNTQFKKAYALINQTLLNVLAQYDYLPRCYYLSGTSIGPSTDCVDVSEKFFSSLKVVKKCEGNAHVDGCIPEYEGMDTVSTANNPDAEVPDGYEDYGEYVSRDCTNFRKNAILNDRTVYVLADGTIIFPYDVVGYGVKLIAVDTNGMKGPNKWGYDLYSFIIRSDGQRFRYLEGGCMAVEEGGTGTTAMISKLERNEL